MKYPKKELAQLVIAACAENKIESVVISPGSRNAPLTIGFSSHPSIKAYSIVDERCAAFFALGIAQQTQKPVAVLCTSGSALLNYYPAVSEAYYSDIPLVVISADRPKHLIDIGDGQTIRQENVFETHSLFNANLVEFNTENSVEKQKSIHEQNSKLVNEALFTAIGQQGPVHINVPFDEPLYETVEDLSVDLGTGFEKKTEERETEVLLKGKPLEVDFLQGFADIWNSSECKMVLVGTNDFDALLQTQLDHLVKDPSVLVFTETTSNVSNEKFINSIDQLVFPLEDFEKRQLQPDVLLTLGGMVVSKKIKQLLRKFQPKHHWHVDQKNAPDTFHCLTQHFKVSPELFFSQFFFLVKPKESKYQKFWLEEKKKRVEKHAAYLEAIPYSDLKAFETVLDSLPNDITLQLSNSSIIRYSQLFDVESSLHVFCNRGTSGIDGSTSTAIGAAVVNEEQTVFITGDISFFYDSNALWNHYIPKNFRIILINNSGGGIFKFIPGPSSSGALEYFETPHQLTADHLCKMYGLEYLRATNMDELKTGLKSFYVDSNLPKLLEIQTPSELNDEILKGYFNSLK